MIALIQRVSHAKVEVEQHIIGQIAQGILALIGVEKDDQKSNADRLLERLLNYRIFSDNEGKMNLNVKAIKGELLLVPQFTLAGDTRKGNRPSFSTAATPQVGQELFDYFVSQAKKSHASIETGKFGADMQVSLCNDGPVTFWLSS
jgi:D-tyrosyl-tRNA(Tyr) deacylase